MQELTKRKRSYLETNKNPSQENADIMHPWDYDYYARLAFDTFHVEHAKISEYFPLQTTISTMLEVFSSCLQLRFKPIPPERMIPSQWHEDVEAWSVWDERKAWKGEFVGYLYKDLLWRPNKHKGSQNINLQCVRHHPTKICMANVPVLKADFSLKYTGLSEK